MKTKTLYTITMIFGLLLIPFGLWSIVELFTTDYNYWSVGIFTILLFITGYLGKEYAAKVKGDPKGFINSFNSKGMIILLLVGLSFSACESRKTILRKPFVIVDRSYYNVTDGCVFYTYQDSTGNEREFYDKEDKYSIGDTLK